MANFGAFPTRLLAPSESGRQQRSHPFSCSHPSQLHLPTWADSGNPASKLEALSLLASYGNATFQDKATPMHAGRMKHLPLERRRFGTGHYVRRKWWPFLISRKENFFSFPLDFLYITYHGKHRRENWEVNHVFHSTLKHQLGDYGQLLLVSISCRRH